MSEFNILILCALLSQCGPPAFGCDVASTAETISAGNGLESARFEVPENNGINSDDEIADRMRRKDSQRSSVPSTSPPPKQNRRWAKRSNKKQERIPGKSRTRGLTRETADSEAREKSRDSDRASDDR
ncbi:uncharacterized protein LOC100898433 [Galendromus occidentalis]|uniref:Uncharacterized protein LOC100898433 n=1 Tax=Galendromus occidentalis TaxID=34638 RepID=A0AAJ6QWX9_9ACAR|nr:uncharacterized protein LOC100898433 [Galendromus occidentalis]